MGKLGGYDLDFGIAADQVFIFRAALLREPITIRRVVCDFDTTGVGSHGQYVTTFATCVACGTYMAATRWEAGECRLLTYAVGSPTCTTLPTLFTFWEKYSDCESKILARLQRDSG